MLPDPQIFINLSKLHKKDGTINNNRIALLEAVKEYGRQIRDKTLEWVAENANTNHLGNNFVVVDQQSILSGKTHKDLEIL